MQVMSFELKEYSFYHPPESKTLRYKDTFPTHIHDNDGDNVCGCTDTVSERPPAQYLDSVNTGIKLKLNENTNFYVSNLVSYCERISENNKRHSPMRFSIMKNWIDPYSPTGGKQRYSFIDPHEHEISFSYEKGNIFETRFHLPHYDCYVGTIKPTTSRWEFKKRPSASVHIALGNVPLQRNSWHSPNKWDEPLKELRKQLTDDDIWAYNAITESHMKILPDEESSFWKKILATFQRIKEQFESCHLDHEMSLETIHERVDKPEIKNTIHELYQLHSVFEKDMLEKSVIPTNWNFVM